MTTFKTLVIAWALMVPGAAAFAQQVATRTDAAGVAPHTSHFSATCAQRDVQAVTLIDDLGDAQRAAGQKLFEAFLIVLRAREACIEGREREALSIYDTVAPSLAATHAAR